MATIISICPYCGIGGVRATQASIGASATCPKCKSSFTVMPSDGLPGWAKEPQPTATEPRPPSSTTEETRPAAAIGMADITEPSPILSVEDRPKTKSKPATELIPEPEAEQDRASVPADMGLVVALVALTLVGVAVVASQFPYGRVVAALLAGLGLAGGIASLGAEGRAKLAGGLAILLHALFLLTVLLLPSWLSLDPWRAPTTDNRPVGPVSVEHGTGRLTPVSAADWIDASKYSWEHRDVRVTVRGVFIGPVDLLGPKDAKRTTKESYVSLRLRIANSGVEREIPLAGWAAGQGAGAVRVTDPSGNVLKPATFEENRQPDRGKPADHLFPGNSSEPRMIFAAPTEKAEWLHVQLPGSALGLTEDVRFLIGAGFLTRATKP